MADVSLAFELHRAARLAPVSPWHLLDLCDRFWHALDEDAPGAAVLDDFAALLLRDDHLLLARNVIPELRTRAPLPESNQVKRQMVASVRSLLAAQARDGVKDGAEGEFTIERPMLDDEVTIKRSIPVSTMTRRSMLDDKVVLDSPTSKRSAPDTPRTKQFTLGSTTTTHSIVESPTTKQYTLDSTKTEHSTLDSPTAKRSILDSPATKQFALDTLQTEQSILHSFKTEQSILDDSLAFRACVSMCNRLDAEGNIMRRDLRKWFDACPIKQHRNEPPPAAVSTAPADYGGPAMAPTVEDMHFISMLVRRHCKVHDVDERTRVRKWLNACPARQSTVQRP